MKKSYAAILDCIFAFNCSFGENVTMNGGMARVTCCIFTSYSVLHEMMNALPDYESKERTHS